MGFLKDQHLEDIISIHFHISFHIKNSKGKEYAVSYTKILWSPNQTGPHILHIVYGPYYMNPMIWLIYMSHIIWLTYDMIYIIKERLMSIIWEKFLVEKIFGVYRLKDYLEMEC